FVGPSQLAKAAGADAAGVSVAGVVPPPTKTVLPVIKECNDAIHKAAVGDLNYTNLEACIAAKVPGEAMRKWGKEGTAEGLYNELAGINHFDTGGYVVSFGPDKRHGSNYVELAVIPRSGSFRF